MRVEVSKSKTAELPGLFFPFAHMEHPPVHPKCRVFDQDYLQAYADKLNAVKDTAGMLQLKEALQKAISQPPRGAWFQFAPGRVGVTYIIPLEALSKLNAVQMTKLGVCGCPHCQKSRRAN